MGLKKSLGRTDNKVKAVFSASYWKISSIRNELGKITVDVKGYADQDARKLDTGEQTGPMMPGSGDITIASKNYTFVEASLPSPTLQTSSESARLKHCVYTWLKTQDDFRLAENVFEDSQNTPI